MYDVLQEGQGVSKCANAGQISTRNGYPAKVKQRVLQEQGTCSRHLLYQQRKKIVRKLGFVVNASRQIRTF